MDSKKSDLAIKREANSLIKIICENWDVDDAECIIFLERYRELFVRMRQAQRDIAETGLKILDRFQQEKPNPSVAIERDCINGMMRILKQLNLDLEPLNPGPGRPAGR